MDTDGAYVSNENVIEDMSANDPIYSPTEIRTCRKKSIEERNVKKKFNMNRLRAIPHKPLKIRKKNGII